jgi:arabinofuranosyltransferase
MAAMAWLHRAVGWARRYADVWALLLLFAATAAYGALLVDFGGPPFEDAAMLMRYSENLAAGHGIVWNIGEPPIDGATDFLFMVSVAGLIKLGLATGRSVRLLGLAAHLLTLVLVYAINRKLWSAGVLVSLGAALYLAVGTGLFYVAAYFGTPFFAFSVALSWALGLLLVKTDSPGDAQIIGFAISALVAALVRPEGAFLAILMLASIVIVRGWSRSRRIILFVSVVMLLGGGLYFVWRWSYFGHALPNPFYKKGGGLLHWDSFWESLGYLLRFAGPFALAFVLGLRSRRTLRLVLAFSLVLVGFAALFILVSNETNFGGRFQYALWPMVLLCFFPLVRSVPEQVHIELPPASDRLGRLAWMLAALVLVFGVLAYAGSLACRLTTQQQSCGIAYEADGRYDVARRLAEYRDRHYVIATSEAGLLPLYSGWTAVDTWGLNDAWIAQNGEVTPEYLDTYRPHVLVFHAYFSPLIPPRDNPKDLENDWHRMTLVLKDYAESRDYHLVAAFGDSPYESHYYYVRADFPDSARISRDIAGIRAYYWYGTGRKAINYAAVQP